MPRLVGTRAGACYPGSWNAAAGTAPRRLRGYSAPIDTYQLCDIIASDFGSLRHQGAACWLRVCARRVVSSSSSAARARVCSWSVRRIKIALRAFSGTVITQRPHEPAAAATGAQSATPHGRAHRAAATRSGRTRDPRVLGAVRRLILGCDICETCR